MIFKKALITGASSGIGEALARLLQEKGVEVMATGRELDKLTKLSDKSLKLDLLESRKPLIDWMEKESPDLVVNNAGFGFYGSAAKIPLQDQLDMVEVNNKALLEITLATLNMWVREGKKGVILNVASAAAFQPFPTFAVYAATKAFVVNLSESLDQEFSPKGIRVLVSCPGMVKTDFQVRASHGRSKERRNYMTPQYAADRLLKQLERGKGVDIFDWKYHAMVRFSQFFLPNRVIGAILRRFL